ncbi:ribosomal protection-like ABC-F family protein [uncultured Clostridium sp.]|uniref:ribosomal protection-like ABC-F family protein n=1 Tax=uncultured Clostridium sp. TaxID=59620 RepID=UPI0025DA4D78|nr:ABC-F family ATP-binding cassette domain-containing protein [uncultured Clostridium sp.]
MAVLIECKNIYMEYGEDVILKNINLRIKEGERLGIVGCNGTGKTTLANVICGSLEATCGSVVFYRDNPDIGYMKQSTHYNDENSSLSCGEKTKKALNEVFYGKHDILILDEPTNHLDYDGVSYIVNKINNFKGTVIMISHDRYFLDQCAERIVEIENGTLHEYDGNYSFYRRAKKEEYENTLKLFNEQEKLKAKINCEIEQTKNWSSKAHREARTKAIESGNKFGGKEFNRAKAKRMDKQIKSRIKRLEKIKTDGIVKPEEEEKVYFEVKSGRKKGSTALYAKDVSKAYGDKVIFRKSSFYIKRCEKIGLFGKNGCGKSTLIKALLGITDYDGELYLSRAGSIGYLSQDVIDLDEESAIIDLFEINNNKDMGIIRTKLDLLGFHNESIYKKIKCLSMGERMKVKLLLMIQKKCDILILDEPTNHIDIHVREQLEEILENFKGTLILVTHDRYMMEKICDKLLVFKDKKIERYEYGLKEYLSRKNDKKSHVNLNNKKHDEECRILIDNRITYVLSQLSICRKDSKEYNDLEKEYEELLKEKNL